MLIGEQYAIAGTDLALVTDWIRGAEAATTCGGLSVPPEIFDDDYIYFSAELFGPERSDADAELIARLLSLESGTRVLDAPCGEGRIAGRLARRGCDVVGVDNSERLLALARERYPEAAFEARDLRALRYAHEFDAVVNWFTSFGYFEPETNDAVLAAFARALRPGGRLLLDMHNPWHLARLLEPGGGSSAYVVERGDDLLIDRASYDQATRRSRTERFIVRDGHVRKLEFSLEQVPAPQLRRRLRRAGFNDVTLFGAGGTPFEAGGRRLIAIARTGPASPQPHVSLREVTRENAEAICELQLAPGQERYVASTADTLVHAAFLDSRGWVRAIYADEQPVGLLVLITETEPVRYLLVRLMIDARHQGRGFGGEAVRLLVEHVRTLPGARALETTCVPGPQTPAGFYRGLGFEDTGRVEHGEDLLQLTL